MHNVTDDFKSYQVTTDRETEGYNVEFKIYGIHDTVQDALVDQLKRAYHYGQKTSLYGILNDTNVIIKLN